MPTCTSGMHLRGFMRERAFRILINVIGITASSPGRFRRVGNRIHPYPRSANPRLTKLCLHQQTQLATPRTTLRRRHAPYSEKCTSRKYFRPILYSIDYRITREEHHSYSAIWKSFFADWGITLIRVFNYVIKRYEFVVILLTSCKVRFYPKRCGYKILIAQTGIKCGYSDLYWWSSLEMSFM